MPRARVALAVAAALWLGTIAGVVRAQNAGDLDAGFSPGVDGYVQTVVVQPDGKILLGGNFTRVNGVPRDRVARLHPDGSLDLSLSASINDGPSDLVSAVAAQPDGSILLGGYFLKVNGQPRNGLARLNPDGSLDKGFAPRVAGSAVSSVIVQPDGRILLGGTFSAVNGSLHYNIARLNADGSLDTGFNAGVSNEDFAGLGSVTLQPDGKILLSGDFTLVNGQPRDDFARLNADGSLDEGFTASARFAASVCVQPDGKILLGGGFSLVNGSYRGYVARLNADGSLDPGFVAHPNGRVNAITVQADGRVLLGGEFTRVNDVDRDHLARLNPDGSLDASFAASVRYDVASLAVQPDGKILLGGAFVQVNGQASAGVARLLPGVPAPPGATVASVVGAPARGGFVFSRTGGLDRAVTLVYHHGGSAVEGVDYVAFPGSLTLAAGQGEAVLHVPLLTANNRARKIKVFLDPAPYGEYGIGKAQSKVFLSDLP